MEDDDENMSTGSDRQDLLWKGVVKPDEPCLASGIDKYFLRITNASFGPDVKKDTRTCLTVIQASDEESDAPGVICTLKNTYENHILNLLVSGDVQFQVSGKNPSPIYLTGYLSPAEQHMSENPFVMDDDDEPTEEELEDMDIETKKQLLQQLGRKRKLAEMEDNLEGDDEDKAPTAQKKQKTAGGKEKGTNPSQDKNQNKNKNQKNTDNKDTKNNKNNNQKKKDNAESPKETDNKAEEGSWKNGPQGLKYKDIRVGDGKPVKQGSKVRVYYVGQLDNKKIFDKAIEGPGFQFTLGANEVIRGWEFGVNGMKVGGKRRLQIPPRLAYGEEGSPPDIPPNAQLTFTVEVKSCT